MKKFTAEEILEYIISLFVYYLEELKEADGYNKDSFIHGEKTAYVECLEIIQKWSKSAIYGLNFDIEERFPI